MATAAGKNPAGGPAGTLANGGEPVFGPALPPEPEVSFGELLDICVPGSLLNAVFQPIDYARCVFRAEGSAPVDPIFEQADVAMYQALADAGEIAGEVGQTIRTTVTPFAFSVAAIGLVGIAIYFLVKEAR